LYGAFDACTGWIAVAIIGMLMAVVACAVDYTEASVASLKYGYCSTNPLLSREWCCRVAGKEEEEGSCTEFRLWSTTFWPQFGIYVGWAALFGVISSLITMLSKRALPAAAPGHGDKHFVSNNGKAADVDHEHHELGKSATGKSMYMAAGSGIPEIKVRDYFQMTKPNRGLTRERQF
jgi:chloride channel 3/4/5